MSLITQPLFLISGLLAFSLATSASHAAEPSHTTPNKYSVSFGSIVFSDFSDNEESDYLGASYSFPVSFSIKQSSLRWGISTAWLTQVQDGTAYKGVGDTNLSLTYTINDSFDIGFRHKFATGDEDLGFSTGEDDNAISLNYFAVLDGQFSVFASAGYKWVGEGDRTDRQNAGNASLGLGYRVNRSFSLMGSLDHYQSSYTTSDDVDSLTLIGSHKINRAVNVGWFVSGDDTDTFSAGTKVGYSF